MTLLMRPLFAASICLLIACTAAAMPPSVNHTDNYTVILTYGQTPHHIGYQAAGNVTGWNWWDTGSGMQQQNLILAMVLDESAHPVSGLSQPSFSLSQTRFRAGLSTYSWKADEDGTGNYSSDMDIWHWIDLDLTGHSNPELTFYTWYRMTPGDFGYVKISTDDGKTWAELANYTGYQTGVPVQKTIDLSGYEGGDAILAFNFVSDSIGTDEGWYIDDIKVVADGVIVPIFEWRLFGKTIFEDSAQSLPPELIVDVTYPTYTSTGHETIKLQEYSEGLYGGVFHYASNDTYSGTYTIDFTNVVNNSDPASVLAAWGTTLWGCQAQGCHDASSPTTEPATRNPCEIIHPDKVTSSTATNCLTMCHTPSASQFLRATPVHLHEIIYGHHGGFILGKEGWIEIFNNTDTNTNVQMYRKTSIDRPLVQGAFDQQSHVTDAECAECHTTFLHDRTGSVSHQLAQTALHGTDITYGVHSGVECEKCHGSLAYPAFTGKYSMSGTIGDYVPEFMCYEESTDTYVIDVDGASDINVTVTADNEFLLSLVGPIDNTGGLQDLNGSDPWHGTYTLPSTDGRAIFRTGGEICYPAGDRLKVVTFDALPDAGMWIVRILARYSGRINYTVTSENHRIEQKPVIHIPWRCSECHQESPPSGCEGAKTDLDIPDWDNRGLAYTHTDIDSDGSDDVTCRACHNALHDIGILNCVNCHRQPPGGHESIFPDYLATTYEDCLSCHHDPHNEPEHAAGGDCADCHLSGGVNATGGIPIIDKDGFFGSVHFNITGDFDASNRSAISMVCWGCHNDYEGQLTDPRHFTRKPDCEDCHTDPDSWNSAYLTPPQVLEHQPDGIDVITPAANCTVCHNKSLVAGMPPAENINNRASRNFISHYGRKRTDIIVDSGAASNCAYCHRDGGNEFGDVFADPSKADITHGVDCAGCHGYGRIHDDVFTVPVMEPGNNEFCLDCHDDDVEGFEVRRAVFGAGIHAGANCTDCHTPLPPSTEIVEHPGTTPHECEVCHVTTPVYGAPQAMQHIQDATVIHVEPECMGCHNKSEMILSYDHDLESEAAEVSHYGKPRDDIIVDNGSASNCAYCHRDGGNEFGDVFAYPANADIGHGVDCAACHGYGRIHDDVFARMGEDEYSYNFTASTGDIHSIYSRPRGAIRGIFNLKWDGSEFELIVVPPSALTSNGINISEYAHNRLNSSIEWNLTDDAPDVRFNETMVLNGTEVNETCKSVIVDDPEDSDWYAYSVALNANDTNATISIKWVSESWIKECAECHLEGGKNVPDDLSTVDIPILNKTGFFESVHVNITGDFNNSNYTAISRVCWGCHNDYKRQLTDPTYPKDHREIKKPDCTDCHDTRNPRNADYIDPPQALEHQPDGIEVITAVNCTVCHNKSLVAGMPPAENINNRASRNFISHYGRKRTDIIVDSGAASDCAYCHRSGGHEFGAVFADPSKADITHGVDCTACHGYGRIHDDVFTVPVMELGNNEFCLDCHNDSVTGFEVRRAVFNAGIHAGGNCTDCHTPLPPSTEVVEHPGTTPHECEVCHVTTPVYGAPQAMQHTRNGTSIRVEPECMGCHNKSEMILSYDHDLESEAAEVSHYGKPRDDIIVDNGSASNCAYCHIGGGHEFGEVFADPNNADIEHGVDCAACHGYGRIHDDVFTMPTMALGDNSMCFACHRDLEGFEVHEDDFNVGIHGSTNCTDCHTPLPISETGRIREGETLSHEFGILEGVKRMNVTLDWAGSDLDLTLTSPNGTEINPSTAASDPDIDHLEGATSEYYSLRNPIDGIWTANVSGIVVDDTEPEPFTLSVDQLIKHPGIKPPHDCEVCHLTTPVYGAPQAVEHIRDAAEIPVEPECMGCHNKSEMIQPIGHNSTKEAAAVSHYGRNRTDIIVDGGNASDCSYCHTGGGREFGDVFREAENANITHGENCAACHATPGARMRIHDESLTGVGAMEVGNNSLCFRCHADPAIMSDNNSDYLIDEADYSSRGHNDAFCTDCHLPLPYEVRGTIEMGQIVNTTVPVRNNTGSVNLTVVWLGSELSLVVFDPTGREINRSVELTDARITYSENLTGGEGAYLYKRYTIQKPISGNWTVRTTAVEVSGSETFYTTADFRAHFVEVPVSCEECHVTQVWCTYKHWGVSASSPTCDQYTCHVSKKAAGALPILEHIPRSAESDASGVYTDAGCVECHINEISGTAGNRSNYDAVTAHYLRAQVFDTSDCVACHENEDIGRKWGNAPEPRNVTRYEYIDAASDIETTIRTGEAWKLKNGYEITVGPISSSGKSVRINLTHEGRAVKSEIVRKGATFEYEIRKDWIKSKSNVGDLLYGNKHETYEHRKPEKSSYTTIVDLKVAEIFNGGMRGVITFEGLILDSRIHVETENEDCYTCHIDEYRYSSPDGDDYAVMRTTGADDDTDDSDDITIGRLAINFTEHERKIMHTRSEWDLGYGYRLRIREVDLIGRKARVELSRDETILQSEVVPEGGMFRYNTTLTDQEGHTIKDATVFEMRIAKVFR